MCITTALEWGCKFAKETIQPHLTPTITPIAEKCQGILMQWKETCQSRFVQFQQSEQVHYCLKAWQGVQPQIIPFAHQLVEKAKNLSKSNLVQNPYTTSFAKNAIAAAASLIPQELVPYIKYSACLGGASQLLAQMAHQALCSMQGVATGAMSKSISGEIANNLGNQLQKIDGNTSVLEILKNIPEQSLSPVVGEQIAARALNVVLEKALPKARNLITLTSQVQGGSNLAVGLLKVAELASQKASPLVRFGAQNVFQLKLVKDTVVKITKNFFNTKSKWEKCKQLALLSSIGAMAYGIHNKFKKDIVSATSMIALIAICPKLSAAQTISMAISYGALAGGTIGALETAHETWKPGAVNKTPSARE